MIESLNFHDLGLAVRTMEATESPQRVIYAALHQDYSEGCVYDEMFRSGKTTEFGNTFEWFEDPLNPGKELSEKVAGERAIRLILNSKHFGPCYDRHTEILTDKGWVKFPELQDQKVAQWDFDESISFTQPLRVKIPYEGEMLKFGSRHLDMAITPDHKMVISHRKADSSFVPYYWQLAGEAYGRSFRVPTSGKLNVSPEFSFVESAMVGFFLGDGISKFTKDSFVSFRLKLQRKIDFLNSLGFPVEARPGHYFKVEIPTYLKELLETLTDGKVKNIPLDRAMELNFAGFMAGLRNSDGTRVKGDMQFSYDSTSPGLLDTIQALAHLNGIHAHLSDNGKQHLNNPNHNPCRRVCFTPKSHVRFEPTKNRTRTAILEKEEYTGFVYCVKVPTGMVVVRRGGKVFISGNCEHPQIVVSVKGFPHSTMQQLRTHRTGISFDVQSGRYTGIRICDVASGVTPVKDVFWVRPEGVYSDRHSPSYTWDSEQIDQAYRGYYRAAGEYASLVSRGMPYEMARDLCIPYGIRQDFVMSMNLRTVFHIMEMRGTKDAEFECQLFSELLGRCIKAWVPEIYQWWEGKRKGKNQNAP
jgi:thymidylate synthase (FAD)